MNPCLKARRYARMDEVPERLWESIAPPAFFFRRAFLKVMEDSAVEGARYRFLCLLEGDAPVGLAVLSRFVLKLDLLAGHSWVRGLRRWLRAGLDLPIVCCGIPASFGQHHLHLARPEGARAAVALVHREMEEWARESGAAALVWKEWGPEQGLSDHARAHGYLVLPTLPDHRLGPLPKDVPAYLARMRSDYRRKYRQAARLMSGPGPAWADGRLRAEEAPFGSAAASDFYPCYRSVLERAPVRLETYTEGFFFGLAAAALLDARTLRLTHQANGQALTALLIPSGDVLSFALVSKDRSRYDDALYTLLLQCIVLYAIRRGFREVRLGQTSSYAKCAAGARPCRLETFIRMRGPLRQAALRCLGTALFPEVAHLPLRVFKDGAGEEERRG